MKGGRLLHGADVGGLDDVFGDGMRADAVLDKAEELLSLIDETVDGFGGHESLSFVVSGVEFFAAPRRIGDG